MYKGYYDPENTLNEYKLLEEYENISKNNNN